MAAGSHCGQRFKEPIEVPVQALTPLNSHTLHLQGRRRPSVTLIAGTPTEGRRVAHRKVDVRPLAFRTTLNHCRGLPQALSYKAMSRVRDPMPSLNFINVIGPVVQLASNRNEYQKSK
jgi:hypothetical protein